VTRIVYYLLTVRPRPNSVPGRCITSLHTAGSLGVTSLSLPPYNNRSPLPHQPLSHLTSLATPRQSGVSGTVAYTLPLAVYVDEAEQTHHDSLSCLSSYQYLTYASTALHPWVTSQTLPRVCSARTKNPRRAAFSFTGADDTRPLNTQFRTSGPQRVHSCAHKLISCILSILSDLSCGVSFIRELPLLPAAELPLAAQIFFRVNTSTSLLPGTRPLGPIERVHQMAEAHVNGAATPNKTEWYAGATRFELELEV
jgi:hypothetical protein